MPSFPSKPRTHTAPCIALAGFVFKAHGWFIALTAGLLPAFFPLRATAAPGDVDALNVTIAGEVRTTAVQPDGKLIIAGSFTSVAGVARSNIARLHANGTLDQGFDPKADDYLQGVAVQADGRCCSAAFSPRCNPTTPPPPRQATASPA